MPCLAERTGSSAVVSYPSTCGTAIFLTCTHLQRGQERRQLQAPSAGADRAATVTPGGSNEGSGGFDSCGGDDAIFFVAGAQGQERGASARAAFLSVGAKNGVDLEALLADAEVSRLRSTRRGLSPVETKNIRAFFWNMVRWH